MVALLRYLLLSSVPFLCLAVFLTSCQWPTSRRSSEKVMFRFRGVDKAKLARAEGEFSPEDPRGRPRPAGAPGGSLDSYSYRVPTRQLLYFDDSSYTAYSTTHDTSWGVFHEDGSSYHEPPAVASNYFVVPRHEPILPEGDVALRFDVEASREQRDATGGVTSVRVRLSAPGSASGKEGGLNLAIVLDVSRSMGDPEKLALLRAAAHHFVDQLMPDDRVALVAFGRDVQLLLSSEETPDRVSLHHKIETILKFVDEGNDGVALFHR